MKLFNLIRNIDTNITKTGVVAQGVIYDDGLCAVHWFGKYKTTVIHDNIDSVLNIHCSNLTTSIMYIYGISQNDINKIKKENNILEKKNKKLKIKHEKRVIKSNYNNALYEIKTLFQKYHNYFDVLNYLNLRT